MPADVLPLPPARPLSLERGFPDLKGRPNHPLITRYLYESGTLSKPLVLQLLSRTAAVLRDEPNLLRVDGKVVIIGDIHG